MFLIDKWLTNVLVGDVEFNTNHEAASANVLDMWAVNLLDLLHQVVANLAGVFYQILLFEHVEYGQCSSTCQMVAAKRSAQLSVDGLEVGTDEYGTHGESVGDALSHRDDVGLDAQPLVGKELSASSVTALYLVANQRSTKTLAGISQLLGEIGGSHLDSTYTLDAFQDDRCHTTTRQFANPRLNVVQRKKAYMVIVVDGSYNLWIIGHLDSQRRTSVESMLTRQDALGRGILERCQLQGILVGLSSAVDEKQLIVFITTDLAQSLCQLLLQLVDHRIGIKTNLPQLFRHLLDIVRVGMSNRNHCVTTIKVKILLSLVVPYFTTLSLHDVDVEQGIYVE